MDRCVETTLDTSLARSSLEFLYRQPNTEFCTLTL